MNDMDLADNSVLVALVAIAAGALVLTGINSRRFNLRRWNGLFQYFSWAILLSLAVSVLTSGRSLTSTASIEQELLAQRSPVAIWTGRLCSYFLLLASLDRSLDYLLHRRRIGLEPYVLLLVFAAFWFTSVASPSFLGAHGSFSHDYLYTLLMGCAAVLLSQRESDAALAMTRNALLVLLGISVVLLPVRPALVADWHYQGGLLPGVPRLAGLTPDPISLGMLARLALLCLYAKPLEHPWANRCGWALGLSTLLLAQSKAAWVSFPICLAAMSWFRADRLASREAAGPRRRRASLVMALAALLVTLGLGFGYAFGSMGLTMDSLVTGERAANIKSLTGRDRIWAVALEEWARHPTFGFGTDLFDDAFRADIQMPHATHAHNELIDTLARGGLVSAAGLLVYVIVLLVMSMKYARATRGLSLAIFLAIAFQSVTEVPLHVFTYGPDVLQHFLLLAILGGAARPRPTASEPPHTGTTPD